MALSHNKRKVHLLCAKYRKIKLTPSNTIHYHPDNSVHKSGPTVTIVGSLDHFNQEMDLGRTGDVMEASEYYKVAAKYHGDLTSLLRGHTIPLVD